MHSGHSTAQVLVVEDNPFTIQLLTDVFEYLNVSMCSAPSAAAAHAAMEAHGDGFELALVDRMLPDGDGQDICRTLRARLPNLAIIQMTGLPVTETDPAVVNGNLSKPFDLEALECLVYAFTSDRVAPRA